MPHIFGRHFSREELQRFTTTLSPIAGVRLFELSDAKARGLRVADVYTGSGFRFQVFLDRAMDIGSAEYAGVPLAWLHPALGTPAQYEPQGAGWLRTFGGGLLTTCGLTHIGQPDVDEGEALGLHGRIAHIPASQVHVSEEWQADDYVIRITGQVRQSVLFGENLLLTRTLTTRMGASNVLIEDTVRNEGYRATPHMVLYHCNFGFPIVSPDSELLVDSDSVTPHDEQARLGLDEHKRFVEPVPAVPEQVFVHRVHVDAGGLAQAALVNRAMNLGAYVRYRARELPFLWQWKMLGAGEYVCALEPSNHPTQKRSGLRAQFALRMLEPGEQIHYHVELGVLTDVATNPARHQSLIGDG